MEIGMDNLKLCPFCGSEPKIVAGTEYVGDIEKDTFNVVCTNPECIIFDGYGRSFYTLANTKDAWNDRI
jgi:hypothetical protein